MTTRFVFFVLLALFAATSLAAVGSAPIYPVFLCSTGPNSNGFIPNSFFGFENCGISPVTVTWTYYYQLTGSIWSIPPSGSGTFTAPAGQSYSAINGWSGVRFFANNGASSPYYHSYVPGIFQVCSSTGCYNASVPGWAESSQYNSYGLPFGCDSNPTALPYSLCSGIPSALSTAAGGLTTLYQNSFLRSPNSLFSLLMQTDANLVGYMTNGFLGVWAIPFWNAGSQGRGTPPYRFVMQSNGVIKIVDATNTPIWAVNPSSTTGPFQLLMQDDRNIVLYDGLGVAQWSSGTWT